MEANEAPEKLWIDPATDLPKLSGHIDNDSVEYISTDTFIEKAEKWIDNFLSESTLINYKVTPIVRNAVIENFKNYMKGK